LLPQMLPQFFKPHHINCYMLIDGDGGRLLIGFTFVLKICFKAWCINVLTTYTKNNKTIVLAVCYQKCYHESTARCFFCLPKKISKKHEKIFEKVLTITLIRV